MALVRRTASTVAIIGLGAGTLSAQSFRTVSAARLAQGEDSMRVEVEFAAGILRVAPGEGRALYQGEVYYDEDTFRSTTHYDTASQQLRFRLSALKRNLSVGRLKTLQRMHLALAPQVPSHFSLELGAAEAELELGGLSLLTADIETGAARTTVTFTRPNRIVCRSLTLVAGAVEFRADGLGNAKCERISFRGGVGDVTLDFSGDWAGDTTSDAEIQLGLGRLTLRLPEDLGVAIEVDRFLASFDKVGLAQRGDTYFSEGYDSAGLQLHLSLKAVFGDIDIEWIEP